MGSSVTTVGNNGGQPLFTFSAAGQDSGSLLCDVMGSVILGYKNALFQLTGSGTNYAITAWGTIDVATATNAPGNNGEWVELPAPSTEASYQWANPMQTQDGRKTLFCGAPYMAYRFTSAALPGQTVTGTVTVQCLIVP